MALLISWENPPFPRGRLNDVEPGTNGFVSILTSKGVYYGTQAGRFPGDCFYSITA